jgi:hypothetical protein
MIKVTPPTPPSICSRLLTAAGPSASADPPSWGPEAGVFFHAAPYVRPPENFLGLRKVPASKKFGSSPADASVHCSRIDPASPARLFEQIACKGPVPEWLKTAHPSPAPSLFRACTHKSATNVRFRANWTLNRDRRMTECDPRETSQAEIWSGLPASQPAPRAYTASSAGPSKPGISTRTFWPARTSA